MDTGAMATEEAVDSLVVVVYLGLIGDHVSVLIVGGIIMFVRNTG